MMYHDRRAFLALRRQLRELASECTGRPEAGMEACLGSIKSFDAHLLAKELRRRRPSRILEIGSFLGLSARWMLEVCSPWGGTVLSIDPNIPHWSFSDPAAIRAQFLSAFPQRHQWLRGFFGSPSRLQGILALHPGIPSIDGSSSMEPFDAVFIDGDHGYDAVADDFREARRLLRADGTAYFHDVISHPEVTRLLDELGRDQAMRVRIPGRWIDRLGRLLVRKGLDGVGVVERCGTVG
jgi:predicted O-methyltransferase YrrM